MASPNGVPIRFSFSDISMMTDGFSDQNFIAETEYFKVFTGKFLGVEPQTDVTVKIWRETINHQEKLRKLKYETTFLAHQNVIDSPNIVKSLGYCCEVEHVGAVYALKSVATLENLKAQDDFQWRDRLVVALGIARLFEVLQCSELRHLIHSAITPYIILDQDMNPVLYDIGMLTDGIGQHGEGAVDSSAHDNACYSNDDGRSRTDDVFSFGMLVLRLICKETPFWSESVCAAYRRMLRQNFFRRCDYDKVFQLAALCIDSKEKRPTISEVVQCLESLLLFSLPVRTSGEKVVVRGRTLVYFSYDDLRKITDGFGIKSLFSYTQLGKAYRGKIQHGWKDLEAQDVIVKIWRSTKSSGEDNVCRLRDEVLFLTHELMIDHPNLVKLYGYCFDVNKVGAFNVGVVYSLKPLDTLQNLFGNDEFEWKDRIKVGLELANLLQLLHGNEPQYVVRNICAAHIMVDQDKTPILYDFSMLEGQNVSGMRVANNFHLTGSDGYRDPYSIFTGPIVPQYDIYAFGVLLVSLICKCDMTKVVRSFIDKHFEDEYKSRFSFAH